MTDFDWGANDDYSRSEIGEDVILDRIYEKHYEVKEWDIVLDIGANVGAFTYSILPKNPTMVYCVEPSNTLFKTLQKNVGDHPAVVLENKAIESTTSNGRDIVEGKVWIHWNEGSKYDTITFRDFLDLHEIDHVDLMKFDCEGGEFSIFTEENIEFIQNNIKNLAGEWHFSNIENAAEKFFKFRDSFLVGKDYHVYERNGKEITKEILDNEYIHGFMAWYNQNQAQLMVYIAN